MFNFAIFVYGRQLALLGDDRKWTRRQMANKQQPIPVSMQAIEGHLLFRTHRAPMLIMMQDVPSPVLQLLCYLHVIIYTFVGRCSQYFFLCWHRQPVLKD